MRAGSACDCFPATLPSPPSVTTMTPRAATNAMAVQDPSATADLTAFPTVQDEHRRLVGVIDDFTP